MIDLRQYRANTQRRFGSAQHYHVGWVIDEAGHLLPILLTDSGVREARDRAIVNREDVPASGDGAAIAVTRHFLTFRNEQGEGESEKGGNDRAEKSSQDEEAKQCGAGASDGGERAAAGAFRF